MHIDYARADVQFSLTAPPPELVSRIHLLGRCGEGLVVCASENGWRFLPGGTREPGESVQQQLDREIGEESGARRTGPWSFFGAHRAVSHGEQVTEVQVLSPPQAVACLAEHDPIHADVVRLADAMGLLGRPAGVS